MRTYRSKKLRLASETLRALDNPSLMQVGGGINNSNGTLCDYTICLTSCNIHCNTNGTCTTRFC